MEKSVHRASVGHLVSFLLRSGDIDMGGYLPSGALQEGTRNHRRIQREAGQGYQAEVRLLFTLEYDQYVLEVSGIADGIIATDEGVTIDEIKSVSTPLEYINEEYNPQHWAQAQCYAYIYASQQGLDQVTVRLTYCQTESKDLKYLKKVFTLAQLEVFFSRLLTLYKPWAEFIVRHREERDQSITDLPFPYPSFRKGQRDLSVSAYYAIRDKTKLFARAPTGIGKTVSCLFPAIKAMGQGHGEKIFYLTARTITRQVAQEALLTMQEKGLVIRHLTLTSKERICPQKPRACNPVDCPMARGHFDRVNEAIYDILLHETLITREVLEAYAQRHQVCPFEYALDISLWVDCVVCDYNYAFDPRAYLRRFFEEGGDYTFLIDEAHNLVDRAREMFSAQLDQSRFRQLKPEIVEASGELGACLDQLSEVFRGLRGGFAQEYETQTVELPSELYTGVLKYIEAFESYLFGARGEKISDGLMELFFDCIAFACVYRLVDENYITYCTRNGRNVMVKLFCIDPSHLLSLACKKGRTAVFFSATLMPLPYYQAMLGGGEGDRSLVLPSPFDPQHLCLAVHGGISTRYKDRGESMEMIVREIHTASQSRIGNTLVFFPSFEFLDAAASLYQEYWPHDRLLIQERSMPEEEREAFLASFEPSPEGSMLGMAVMGGIFSEGIDLVGDRLSGVVVVGVGLPQICAERDLIKAHFDQRGLQGFDYAYRFPGMNRVLQAAGRLIRSESDRGFILLIDDRFLHRRYLEMYPTEWRHYQRTFSGEKTQQILAQFWRGCESGPTREDVYSAADRPR